MKQAPTTTPRQAGTLQPPVPSPIPAPGGAHAGGRPSGTRRAVVRLSARLIRRGALLLALAAAVYMAVEVATYLAAYPDAASRARLASFQDNPAVRMLQGIPHAVDTPGGFAAWDAGWVLEAIVAVWALLTTARLLRGEEDAERAELLLAAPVRATLATSLQLLVITAGSALIGAAIAAALIAAGTGWSGSLLFGLGVAGFGATFAGVAAVTAQVLNVRRRVVAIATAVFSVFFLVRMVANSNDARGWLRWLTPFGWMDELRPYGDNRWFALIPLLVAAVLLGATAVMLRGRRDTGGALRTQADQRHAHLRLLGSPAAFAWRSTQGVLAGWLLGVAAYALMVGSLVKTMTDYLASDPNYRKVLQTLGMSLAETTKGFIGVMGILLGVVVALYACWRLGATRAEEAAGRAEHILTRPVARLRWLGGHCLLTLGAAALLTVTSGLAMWAGAAMVGADVALTDALASTLNTLPVAMLFGGLAVATFGTLPRLTVGLPVAAAVVAYLMELLGSSLDWPTWVTNLSPFHHLAYVPAEPFASQPALVMASLGVLITLLGMAAFQRRDLTGA
jgi:ABC-2 type transport system permease protein